MQRPGNKIVKLNTCRKVHDAKLQQKVDGRYQCTMSGNRLSGFCELLIYDSFHHNAEIFRLFFSIKGVTGHDYLDKEEVAVWKYHKKDAIRITYCQALILLGDAVRQNYKHQTDAERTENYNSLHIQRAWEKAYYDHIDCSIEWLLDLQEPEHFVSVYLDAIKNKDAVLLYDVMAKVVKQELSREVYVYSWNHVLEEMMISSYEIVYVEKTEDTLWSIYITLCGEYGEQPILSVDVCLKLLVENGNLRLLHEYVMDANYISNSDL